MDVFSDIAAKGIGGRSELLADNKPFEYKKHITPLSKCDFVPVNTNSKISTKDELYKELDALKAKFKPFLENHAPQFSSLRNRIDIKECLLDGVKTKLPHYGGEVGNAMQTYECEFILESVSDDKSYNICFNGADYKAVVYVNGRCLGTHEGFFSPFEFCFDDVAVVGKNTLKVELYNDYIYMGNAKLNGDRLEGDKLYAATGLGWDDPALGWHHCPPGMGIYNDVYVEIRNRLSMKNAFVRENEISVDVVNYDYDSKNIEFNIHVYGQNFKETVVENFRYVPETHRMVGMGDTLTEAQMSDSIGKSFSMPAKKGDNTYNIPFSIENPKIWNPDTPYLYQLQIELICDGKVLDRYKTQFGIRKFTQDTLDTPKGMFYLNGEKVRLRGANTMGFEQQDVLREDYSQLIDDILLAKLCNMNFLRLTQRPVQDKVYEYCDKLGMMTQTDLPLFGCMRRNKLAEGIRQAEEMEMLIRNHPCNVVVSYINEPFPNANNEPHRHLNREELEKFFTACDIAVKHCNPDRVIKHIDGDYDPPCETMPDNHCYPMWYNGHGIDIGNLHKGYWLPTKPDWYYGCGEYGAEGLDFYEVMANDYPKEWLREPFDPNNIVNAQTGSFHYFFYDTCSDIHEWIRESQAHQAFATKIMTEAFRRNRNMISSAIHLFIDAWPSGWMKTIMDCKRQPKPAYFEYRNALEPIMISLRTDRFTYFADEEISVECYVCNDTNIQRKCNVIFETEEMTAKNENVSVLACDVTYVSDAVFKVNCNERKKVTLKAILTDENGNVITHNSVELEVFPRRSITKESDNEIIMMLEPGEYFIAGETVKVKPCGMLPVHFVSRNTGHKAVSEFLPKDFSYWYSKNDDKIIPLCYNTFEAEGFTPILTSGNKDENGVWKSTLVCAEKNFEGKKIIICNVDLRTENPVAAYFLDNLKCLED